MKLLVQKGKTSYLANIFVQDSSSTTGAGLTGLVYNTSSLVAYYSRADQGNAAATAWTLATMTRGTWATGGFVEKDATNMPGVYEIGIPNACLATGSDYCVIMFKGATNMAPVVLEIQLTAIDVEDGVHLGITGIPNAAAGATGGLPLGVDSSGRVDVLKINGTSQTARDIGASVLLSSGTGTGQLDFTSGVVKANATQWLGGTIPAVNVTGVPLVDLKYTLGTISPAAAGSVGIDWAQVANKTSTVALTGTTVGTATTVTNQLTAAAIATGVWQDATAGDFTAANSVGKSIMNGVALGTGLTINGYTGNTPQTGDAYARLGAPAGASVSADVAAVKGVLPSALTGGGNIKADVLALNGSTAAAANLSQGALGLVTSTCTTGSSTTSIVTNLTNVTDNFYNGRVITFTSGTLAGETSTITSYSGATKTLTVQALTGSPVASDAFVIS